ncbi:MAG TPA: glycine C-acetyltransferase [Acidobacteriota bacterium]|nr:glycine C-acetyltransferase [Acidobacteriota bacterium]
MYDVKVKTLLQGELDSIRESGLYKEERIITSAQGARVETKQGPAVNLCANNYLGLANHPEVVEAAQDALDSHGFGMSSVRFICGTQDLHKELEARISDFLGTEDTILYPSCFDANGGLFEVLLGPEDCVISDALNHASIIDGVRLCKAQRRIYKHADMDDLRGQLEEAQGARIRLIASDGVFSMHGDLAPLPEICDLAEDYDALVMIDECHATGFLGETGRGTPEHFGLEDRIDIITGTLGKALGGASGGFTSARREIVGLLRQRSRPYLFSNTVAPSVAAGSLKALEIVEEEPRLVRRLQENTRYFRERMTEAGFEIQPGIHPIVPIMLGDEKRTVEMAGRLNRQGIFVVGFSYPVVPKGEARIRVQISAAHSRADLDRAIETFTAVGRDLAVIRQ